MVISEWNINNYIQKDRYKSTIYQEEKEMLHKENGVYRLDTFSVQDVSKTYTQVSIGKNSIDKSNIYSANFDAFWKVYPRKKEKAKAYKAYNARLKDGFSDDELLKAATAYAEECKSRNTEERYIKLGATFLSANTPFEDYLKEGEEDGQSIAQQKENSNQENRCRQ